MRSVQTDTSAGIKTGEAGGCRELVGRRLGICSSNLDESLDERENPTERSRVSGETFGGRWDGGCRES